MENMNEAIAKLNGERQEAAELIMKNGMQQHQSVIFMTPAFDYNVTLGFLRSFYESAILLARAGINVDFQAIGGDPYLAKVRNLLVSVCLKNFPQATDFFFLDADIEWDPRAVLALVQRPEPIVAGIYPKKNDIWEFPAGVRMLPDGKSFQEKNGLLVADLVPTGFLRVKRHVYEEMAAVSPQYKDGTGGGQICWNLFESGFFKEDQDDGTAGQWWGEDYAWGRRAQAMGYDLFIYPDIEFGHRGGKTWRNNFNHSVQAVRDGNVKMADELVVSPSPTDATEPEAVHGDPSPVAASLAAD